MLLSLLLWRADNRGHPPHCRITYLLTYLQTIEVILHIAAETHVDNSIDTPVPFVENNIKSTLHLLEVRAGARGWG